MGEIEGTYRVIQTPGARLGAQRTTGISTLEPGQTLSMALSSSPTKATKQDLCSSVLLLDDTLLPVEVGPKTTGQALLSQVFTHLNVVETDYFGIEFQTAQSQWVWLEPLKFVNKQLRKPKNAKMRLAVKFFPPDPGQLQEEYTRYLFAMQIKRDLAEERLVCSDNTTALLISLLLQSEVGDYDQKVDQENLRSAHYVPRQYSLEERILDCHRQHLGMSPADADFQILEISRRLELYGTRFHLASDREGAKINLSVSHMGVLVFQGNTKINTFNWSKIRKLSFKRRRFLIKLHPEVHDALEFLLPSRDMCKRFWKICVEYHSFFRLQDQPKPKSRTVLLSRGSSFRYSGRTQKQLIEYVRDTSVKRPPYERRHSKPRVSPCTVIPDSPKQILPFTESVKNPTSPSSLILSPQSFFNSSDSPLYKSATSNEKISTFHRLDEPVRGAPENMGSSVHSPLQGCHLSPVTLRLPSSTSPPGRSPLMSPALSDSGSARADDMEEMPDSKMDEAFYITKEILSTETSHLKDIEVITVWLEKALSKGGDLQETAEHQMKPLFSCMEPIRLFHQEFLQQLEDVLSLWEGRSARTKDMQILGDFMLRNMTALRALLPSLHKLEEVFLEMQRRCPGKQELDTLLQEFEQQRICYLPLSCLLLKPLQRPLQYEKLLERLCRHYPPSHHDYNNCQRALGEASAVSSRLRHRLLHLQNLQRLDQLERDLMGGEHLCSPGREFIREGCLYKLTKSGLQQRMFYLFSDMLLYTRKGLSCTNQFRVHGRLPLHACHSSSFISVCLYGHCLQAEDSHSSVPHCFTIYSAQTTIGVAASSQVDMRRWLDDLNAAISRAPRYSELSALSLLQPVLQVPGQIHHPNTLSHVCWYRNQSVSLTDHITMMENQLSGYLLRKFKNSNGWQRLWVIFTNFCLFFYKTHQEDAPLASLPLLGYTVSIPSFSDPVTCRHVFKLNFKSHVYFFRADSDYTWRRWMEVIRRGVSSPGKIGHLAEDGVLVD
ncbi:FERM, ARHGEF and pleckstrin domain-containing protein 2 isoform X2 [Hyla sarda]|uniref:FERM, ARHGEF and pleckstrin domain-containing protein 2 isoform X2 n=1 Tax=Hyla sarda TaxID=327740 RepID=UPI0024C25F0C|nr:FERM, ARHGEF and pleckstrin domain-containing protein 2 isoform X2 [Hyla sarda]